MKEICAKLAAGVRLDAADGEAMFACADIHALGALADAAKRSRHGDRAFYIANRHINYTNLCVLACEVCGFGKRAGQEGVYELTNEQMAQRAAAAQADGACELHVTGALHPQWRIEHYEDMLRAIRAAAPKLHVKAFTAVEVAHFAALSGISVEETLRRLIGAGLDSMPGGGAEIFAPSVRARLFPDKIDARQWLEVHATAHRLGLRTNATMLYGHLETPAHRVAHLLALRELQDATGGFQAFVPLSFIPRSMGILPMSLAVSSSSSSSVAQPPPAGSSSFPAFSSLAQQQENNKETAKTQPRAAVPQQQKQQQKDMGKMPMLHTGGTPVLHGTTGLDDLKTVAVARLMLDNFAHIKTFWVMHTLKLSQVALHYGADDIDGTVDRYEIVRPGDGGAVSAAELCRRIQEAGLTPVERDSLYRSR